jgi:hypothetical protein
MDISSGSCYDIGTRVSGANCIDFAFLTHCGVQVVKVEPMDSLDQANLKLLDRPDLGITFTKVRMRAVKTMQTKFITVNLQILAIYI